jgi:RNA polymerase-binding transcription factor
MKTANATNKTSSNSTKQVRRLLEEKSTELRSHLRLPSANPLLHASDEPSDSADFADKTHEEWIFLQTNSADVEVLRDIDTALRRLREGSYGICMDCGIAITRKRLDAVPWARYCVTCQERRQTGNN